MSLLERINQRNMETAQTRGTEAQAAQQEAAAPDANVGVADARGAYGDAIAAGPQQELSDEPLEPGEQEQFTKAEQRLAEAVYGPASSESIISMVVESQDPVEGVGKAAADLVGVLGNKFPDLTEDVKLGLGEAAVEQVVDLVESSQAEVNFTPEQMAEAFSIALGTYMDANPDAVDDDMQMYMAEDAPEQLAPQGQQMPPQAPQAPQEQPQQQPAIAALGAAQAPQ